MQGRHVSSTPNKNAFSKAVDGTNTTRLWGRRRYSQMRDVSRQNLLRLFTSRRSRLNQLPVLITYGSLDSERGPSGGMRERRFHYSRIDLRGCVVAVR